jgi:hypothetical protein
MRCCASVVAGRLQLTTVGGNWANERVEIGKQSSLKQKWEYPLRVQVSLFVICLKISVKFR